MSAWVRGKMAKREPVYEGIKSDLRSRIDSGALPEGARVPSEHELAKQLGVSRNQTRQALRELELEGLLVRKQGSGTYVAPRADRVSVLPEHNAEETTAIVFPRYGSRYFHQVIDGFLQHMSQAAVPTIAYNIQSDKSSEPGFLQSMCENGLAGMAIWLEHDTPEAREVLRRQCERRFPIVFVDRYVEGFDLDFVVSDNIEIGCRLTKALIDQGHQRIAFFGTPTLEISSVTDRFAGYRQALEEASIEPDDLLVMDRDRFRDTPSDVAKDVLSLRDRPTGFVCINDGAGAELRAELATLGYRVPDDVELASVDDDHHNPHLAPAPFWAVAQDGHAIGTTTAELLLRRIVSRLFRNVTWLNSLEVSCCVVGAERVFQSRWSGTRGPWPTGSCPPTVISTARA